ncbi:hypothetical protein [Paenibacillus sp. CAA11]|uniref:hypothetical protein n=1 Tax=Paenibacillus sp. CAA11 TaxID=1532905 RepID=UPI00131F45BD|nr:hypothetical protein [Paenibacillus sp. CAA11]
MNRVKLEWRDYLICKQAILSLMPSRLREEWRFLDVTNKYRLAKPKKARIQNVMATQ